MGHWGLIVLGRVRVDLASGPAWRLDYVGQSVPQSAYLLGWNDGILALDCFAFDPPDDRWLSIAETFEFLPAEE